MKKIIGILICMLLIIAALPAIGAFSTEKIKVWENKVSEPDLYCEGRIVKKIVKSGSIVTGNFTVENNGESNSLLEWMVTSWPEFGTNWTFNPTGGIDLTPADNKINITVTFTAPIVEQNVYFGGLITICNANNPSDFEVIAVNINVADKSYTEEYSKKNELHTISLTATCDTFAFSLSLHLSGIWLLGSHQDFTFFAIDNVTLKVDGEIVEVNTPVTIEIWGFKGWAISLFKLWLTTMIGRIRGKEKGTFDVLVYGICNSVEFHEPTHP